LQSSVIGSIASTVADVSGSIVDLRNYRDQTGDCNGQQSRLTAAHGRSNRSTPAPKRRLSMGTHHLVDRVRHDRRFLALTILRRISAAHRENAVRLRCCCSRCSFRIGRARVGIPIASVYVAVARA